MTTSGRFRPLSAEEMPAVLSTLPGWTGDSRRVVRTVDVADADALLEQVAVVEAELDHHAAVQRDGHAVTFTLWTHMRDAVTGADVELAQRINEVVARLAGDG